MPQRPWAAVLAVLLMLLTLGRAVAQDVQLRSLDGSVALDGTLLAYDGAYYQVETIYGPLTVAADGVRCLGPGCPDLTTFVAEAIVAGEAALAETLLPALLQGFAATHGMGIREERGTGPEIRFALTRADGSPAARFRLRPGTTADGFAALADGRADLALALRPPNAEERQRAAARAPNDPPLTQRVRVLALDALVAAVAPENPVDAISLTDLARIYAGEIDNWAGLGGPDAPIALHTLAPEAGLSQAFAALIRSSAPQGPAIHHASTQALAEAVAQDPFGIGVTTQSALGETRALALRGACGFTQWASVAATKAEDYPLTAPAYLYLAPQRLPALVRAFLEYAETEAAEQIVARAGFVSQSLSRIPLPDQGARLANAISAAGGDIDLDDLQALVDAMRTGERLSATFRFAGGSSDLDPQSRAAISHLVAAIERGVFDGRRLVFVGFSDGAGPAAANARLSLERAETVRTAVAAAAADPNRVALAAVGFGEVLPMACDDTSWGRAVNRRVEVWIE